MLLVDQRPALREGQILCLWLAMPYSGSILSVALQFRDNLAHGGSAFFNLIGRERNRADHSVTATAIALADRGDVVPPRAGRPWIRTDGDLGSLWRMRQGH